VCVCWCIKLNLTMGLKGKKRKFAQPCGRNSVLKKKRDRAHLAQRVEYYRNEPFQEKTQSYQVKTINNLKLVLKTIPVLTLTKPKLFSLGNNLRCKMHSKQKPVTGYRIIFTFNKHFDKGNDCVHEPVITKPHHRRRLFITFYIVNFLLFKNKNSTYLMK